MPDADWRPNSATAPGSASEGSNPYAQGIARSASGDPSSSSSFHPRALHPPDHHLDPFRYPGPGAMPPYTAPHGQSGSFDSSQGGASASGAGPTNLHYYPHLPMSASSSASAGAPPPQIPMMSAAPGHTMAHHHGGAPFPPPHPSYFPPSFWGAASGGLHHHHHHPLAYPNHHHPAMHPPPHHQSHHQHPHHNLYGHPNHHGPPPPPQQQPPHGLMLPPLMHGNEPRHPGQGAASAAPHQPPHPGAMMHPYEYITDIHPQDVLSGRGGATNSHSGNRTFRALVKQHQEQYLKAKKRDKPGVAALIVELVRKRGGRFLRRIEGPSKAGPSGFGYAPDPNRMPLYVDIGDERAMEKTCQALREGAPEIRRKKQGGDGGGGASQSEDSTDHTKSPASSRPGDALKTADSHSPTRPSLAVALSTTSTSSLSFDMNAGSNVSGAAGPSSVRLTNKGTWSGGTRKRTFDSPVVDRDEPRYYASHHLSTERLVDGPIMIRPAAKLMPGRAAVPPYPLDQLSAEDRDLYLAFLPPYPSIRTKRSKSNAAASSIGDDENQGFDDHGDDDDGGGGGEGRHRPHQRHSSASVPSVLPIVRV